MAVSNINEAVPKVAKLIERSTQNDRVFMTHNINNRKHRLLQTERGLLYHVLYKSKPFKSFGLIFTDRNVKEFCDEVWMGAGDSVNVEYVQYAMRNDIDTFVFVYPDGAAYIVPVRELFDFATKNQTIRTTYSGERTMSFPLKMFRSWKL